MSANDITLCLIVKNEAVYLDACIRSAHAACADIIIVDTGSTDATVEIAQRYTRNVFALPFLGDFSAARNAALERVQTGWVLFLDADERFEPEEAYKLLEIVADARSEVFGYRLLRYNFFATGGFYSGRQLKLFRSDSQVRYRRKVNESVTESIADVGGNLAEAPLMLNHFGHCRPVGIRNAKAWYYIELMKVQLAEQPDDPILYGYIGLILRTLGRFAEALEWSNRSVQMAPGSVTVQMFHGHVLRSTGDLSGAMEAYRQATVLRSTDSAAWNMVGVIELTIGNFDAANEAFERAQSIDPLLVHVIINQGLIAQARGDFASAADLFAVAAHRNSGFLHEEWAGRVEHDPFREFYYETITEYAGLGYHLAYCRHRAGRT